MWPGTKRRVRFLAAAARDVWTISRTSSPSRDTLHPVTAHHRARPNTRDITITSSSSIIGHLHRRHLLAGAVAALTPGLGWTQSSPALNDAEARAGVVDMLRTLVGDSERPLTGISVAWLHGEQRVSRAWAGWRSIAAEHPATSLPIEANTLFRVASISKLVMAVAAMRLHDARVLDLDDDLSGLLRTNLRHPQHRQTPITPRLLLSHRSGLIDGVSLPQLDGDAFRRALAQSESWGPHAPGQYFRYSNLGYAVLATAMEAAARQPFEALMQRWLFDPLGISGRYLPNSLSPEQRDQLATLYRKATGAATWSPQADARAPAPAPIALPAAGDNATVYAPHGGLRLSVPDLARLTKMLMLEGRWEGRRLLSADALDQLFKPQWQWSAQTPGETAGGLFRAWSSGAQLMTDSFDGKGGDRLHPKGGVKAIGHVGMAYGLQAGVFFEPPISGRPPWGLIYVINGMSQAAEEAPGQHSSLARPVERLVERLLDTLAGMPAGR